jgi:spore coat protein CotH
MQTNNIEKISFIGLSLLALLLAGLLIYHHKDLMQPVADSISPFDPNRVATIRIIMKADDWQQLKNNIRAEQYFRADFWFDGQPFKNVAIRPKGMSSLMSARGGDRMPLKVDFNFFNTAQTFRGIKKLNLNNGFSDPTLIRETIAYELFEQMDLPTPRRAFADVWVNDIHLGLYTIVEQVDKAFLRRNFANPEGNLYKPEMPAAFLNWTKSDLDKQGANTQQASESKKQNDLDLKVGGSRLGDLVTVLKREGAVGSELLPNDTAPSSSGGPFGGGPGGMFPGGPPGQFPGDPNRPFARGPGGQFPGDPNRPFGGGFRERESFPGGPAGQFGEPNRPSARGPEGPPGQFPGDPNRPFARGPGGQFPGDPNRPFGGGFRGRGGFGGGPGGPGGGMFGRGGNLIEQMGLKTNENYPDHSVLFQFLEVLNKCPDDTFASEIEKVLDVDEFLRFLAVSVLTVHLDNYIGMGHNYYLYEVDGKFCVIPWDLNMAFGTFGMGVGRGTSIVDFYIDEPTTGAAAERPLVTRLLKYKPYLDKYHQYLEQLLKGGFAEGVIETRIDELVKMIRPFVEADNLKFYSNEDFEKSINEDLSSGGQGRFPPGMGPMAGGRNQRGDNIGMSPPAGDRMQRDTTSGQGRPRLDRGQGQMGQFAGQRGRGAGGGGPGMNAPGLKSFIKQRRLSVREQLNGKRPSKNQI